MSSAARRRLISFLIMTGVLAWAGAVAVVLAVASSGTTQAFTVARGEVPTMAPTPTPARTAARASSRALAAAAAKPPPVVDGVRRSNVGAAHSPRLIHALSNGPAKTPSTMPKGAGARGIDVASYQHQRGAINWAQVAQAGYKFAFIKASEGNYYTNPYYATDLAQAEASGLDATGYAFAVPNVSSGASQASYAVTHAHYVTGGRTMPLALDIEYNPYGANECYGLTPARMVAWLSSFTSEARRLTGHLPIIYTTADWWRSCTGDSRMFGSDPLWVAAWGSSSPPMPSGWRNWTFWQYTSRGRVPGIGGNVDISYFRRAGIGLPSPTSPSPTPSSPSPTPSPTSPSPTPTSPSPTPTSPSPTPTSPAPTSPAPSSPPADSTPPVSPAPSPSG